MKSCSLPRSARSLSCSHALVHFVIFILAMDLWSLSESFRFILLASFSWLASKLFTGASFRRLFKTRASDVLALGMRSVCIGVPIAPLSGRSFKLCTGTSLHRLLRLHACDRAGCESLAGTQRYFIQMTLNWQPCAAFQHAIEIEL